MIHTYSGNSARSATRSALLAVLLCSVSFFTIAANRADAGTVVNFAFSTDPGLYPAFEPSITDYVVRCMDEDVDVQVTVPDGYEASVNGEPGHQENFATVAPMDEGKSFSVSFVDLDDAIGQTYYVRCLPDSFPAFTSERLGTPEAEYYVVNPLYPGLVQPSTPVQTQYVAMFTKDGVPIWWQAINEKTTNGTILANGDMAYIRLGTGVIKQFRLNGEQVREFAQNVDLHELILLPNGNYLIGEYKPLCCYDLTEWGGPAQGTVEDNVIMEVTPDGTVVWEWSTAEHVPLSQTSPNWKANVTSLGNQNGRGYDNYHWNSADMVGDNVVISFRHLDAVYEFNKTTGAINWKLGGTQESYSLTPVNDPVFTAGSNFGGQHDARYWTDGSVTIHDNSQADTQTRPGPPRIVRYALDRNAKTATMVEQVTDSATPVTSAFCCGSARKLPGGNWVAGWGFNRTVAEYGPGPTGDRKTLIQWSDAGYFNYRAEAILPGVFSRARLRTEMNSQYARNHQPG